MSAGGLCGVRHVVYLVVDRGCEKSIRWLSGNVRHISVCVPAMHHVPVTYAANALRYAARPATLPAVE